MAEIDASAWKPFQVGELFRIVKGTRLTKANMMDGNIPFIGASATNNGITAFIANTDAVHNGLALTVCYNGSVGETFLQTEPFWASDDVNILEPIDDVSELALMFVVPCIRSLRVNYGYADKWTSEKMVKDEILLPATPDGDPDWALMESYMKGVMDREEVFANHLASLTAEAVADGHVVDTSTWCDFVFRDVFAGPYIAHAYHAIDLNFKDELSEDYYEYVSRSCVDNAVQGYVSKCDGQYVAQPCGSICFGAETAYFTYHAVEYLTGNKMYWFLFDTTDSYVAYTQSSDRVVDAHAIGLFLCAALNAQLHDKFGYSNGLTGSRCGRQIIKLPATPDGDPDWAFMEAYMRSVMKREAMFADELDRLIA